VSAKLDRRTAAAFEDRVAIITGGASGIGLALGQQLAQCGARIIVADIDDAGAARAVQLLTQAGARSAEAVRVDVTDAAQVETLIDGAIRDHGRLDYMFNNAGIAIIGDALAFSQQDYDQLIDVNIRGVVHGTRIAYSRMADQQHGHVINTASMAGLVPSPLFAAYAMTKHAVVGLTISLRAEGAKHGVRFSALCPGVVATPMVDNSPLRGLDFDPKTQLDELPFKICSAKQCARDALRGVAKGSTIITVTPMAKVAYALQRASPRSLERIIVSEAFQSRAPKRIR